MTLTNSVGHVQGSCESSLKSSCLTLCQLSKLSVQVVLATLPIAIPEPAGKKPPWKLIAFKCDVLIMPTPILVMSWVVGCRL